MGFQIVRSMCDVNAVMNNGLDYSQYFRQKKRFGKNREQGQSKPKKQVIPSVIEAGQVLEKFPSTLDEKAGTSN